MARHVLKATRLQGQAKCKWCQQNRYERNPDCPVTEEMRLALYRFMRKNGGRWKSLLRQCWETGNYRTGDCYVEDDNDIAYLQRYRNSVGPSGLMKLTAPFLEERFTKEGSFKKKESANVDGNDCKASDKGGPGASVATGEPRGGGS